MMTETKYADGTSMITLDQRTFSCGGIGHELPELLDWLNGLVEDVPEQFRSAARVEFGATGFAGSWDQEIEVTVTYWRPTTTLDK
jgi:hypothetical protein